MFENLNLHSMYYFIAWFSTILFVIKLAIFILTGGDMEVHCDFDSISDCDVSFNFLSVQSILAFLMGFGWMGLTVLNQLKLSSLYAVILSILVGLAFMVFSAYLMFMIKKLDKKIVVNYEDYIGIEGKAYTHFAPKSSGQIQIVINKKLETLDVVSVSEEEIQAFSQIKLVKVENKILYIDRI